MRGILLKTGMPENESLASAKRVLDSPIVPVSHDALIQEYTMLKAEQNLRIAMRDHLLYANLGLVGAVCYFALSEHGVIHALLVIPWASFILGWTYLCNDEKISNIRAYIRTVLTPRVATHFANTPFQDVFGWETTHRFGEQRMRYKIIQLAVDLTAFVLSGFAAVVAYYFSIQTWFWWHYLAFTLTLGIMLLLSVEFIHHFLGETKAFRTPSDLK